MHEPTPGLRKTLVKLKQLQLEMRKTDAEFIEWLKAAHAYLERGGPHAGA